MTNWRPDPAFDPIPQWLRVPVETVLMDLQQPDVVDVWLGFEAPSTLWVREDDESGVSGFQPVSRDHVDLLIEVAIWMQEQFFPETRAAWGQARPACPGHAHPTKAWRIGDEACWICPVTGYRISVIGRYGLA